MIGDADITVDRDDNSDQKLLDLIRDSAAQLGYQSFFFARELAIEDDHLPFKNVGVPVADLIDFDYGYNNAFHHTSEDTLDKLSPKSLQIVGDVLLNTLQRLVWQWFCGPVVMGPFRREVGFPSTLLGFNPINLPLGRASDHAPGGDFELR